MFFGSAFPLETGERRVVTVRAHPWVLVRSALPLVGLALAPFIYDALDVALPSLRLAPLFPLFLWLLIVAASGYLLKWLAADLLPWAQQVYVLTDRRLVVRSGVLAVHQRECSLLKVQDNDYTSRGPIARLLDIGDVAVKTMGALGTITLRDVAQPARLQTLISAQARALREEVTRRRLAEAPDEVVRQLQTIMQGAPPPHSARTVPMRAISARAAGLQKHLNLLPNEAVIEVVRQHPIVLAVGLLGPAVGTLLVVTAAVVLGPPALPWAAGVVALALAPWTIWRMLTYLEHEYVLTTERLMELRNTPLLSQTRDIASLDAVQDVALEIPTLFGRLADIGDVIVEVAAAGEQVTLKTVPRPAEIQKLIFETIDARRQRVSEDEDERLVSTLSRWFEEYHKLQQGGAP